MSMEKSKTSLDWGEVEVIGYEAYKKIGGTFSEVEYARVLSPHLHVSQENFQKAFQFCGEVGQGYFPAPEMALLARIITVKPNLRPLNAIAETLLFQGKL